MDILVTGGTGVLGQAVVAELLARGHRVSVLTRRPDLRPEEVTGEASVRPEERAAAPTLGTASWRVVTADLRDADGTGAGADRLREAVETAEAVVHCASDPRRHMRVDVEGTRGLLRLVEEAGPAHLVYVSIVGCDRLPYGYYRSKTLAELSIAQSGVPWTVLRTTRFHDLVLSIAELLTRSPVVPVPRGIADQPVSVLDVAPRVADLVGSGPAGRVPDLGGPEVLPVEQILRLVARALGRERRFVGVPTVGKLMRGLQAGHHLAPERATGARTFEEHVTEHVRADAGRAHVDRPYHWF